MSIRMTRLALKGIHIKYHNQSCLCEPTQAHRRAPLHTLRRGPDLPPRLAPVLQLRAGLPLPQGPAARPVRAWHHQQRGGPLAQRAVRRAMRGLREHGVRRRRHEGAVCRVRRRQQRHVCKRLQRMPPGAGGAQRLVQAVRGECPGLAKITGGCLLCI